MKYRAFLFALASLPLAPAAAHAGKDSDALLQFGLIGTWAFDCQKPPSPADPFINFTPSTADQPTRQIITGKREYDSLVPLSDIAMLDMTHLRLSYPQGGVTVTVTLLKEQRRIRPYEAVASDGTTSVSGGNVKATGLPTNWLLKCADQ
jgi:hypothetical protein